MATTIYKIVPQVNDLNNDLTGRDEVPQQKREQKLKDFLSTPRGVAYYQWARQVPKWDVLDMVNEWVFSVGGGENKIWWVPARNNGVYGTAGRYYWVPVKILEDLDAMAAQMAEEAAAAAERQKLLANAGVTNTGVVGPIGTGVMLPPGPTSGVKPLIARETSYEFSVSADGNGFWTAREPNSSAASQDGNPHPGISIINPGQWDSTTGGMSPHEALSLDEYRQAGWTGLDKKILAWQANGVVQPAGEELASAMDAAMSGDNGALRALRSIGVKPPAAGKLERAGGFLDRLGSFFG